MQQGGGKRDFTGVALVLGLAALGLSWMLQSNGWLTNVLVEVGTAFLLLAPILWITKRIEGRIDESERQTTQRVEELSVAVDTTQEALARTVADISEIVGQRLANERKSEERAFEALRYAPSREDLIEALRRGQERKIISVRGPRTDFFDTDFYLRFLLEEDDSPRVKLRLESVDGEEFHTEEWREGEQLPDVFVSIGRALKERDRWPGEPAYQPGRALEELADLLMLGSRAQARGGRIRRIVQVIESDWAITDRGICSVERDYYAIPARRFEEMDWDQHMRGKPWVKIENFRMAFEIAEALKARGMLDETAPDSEPPL